MIKNYLVFILLILSFMFGEEKDDELTHSEYLKLSWETTGSGFIERNKSEDDRNVEIISTTLYPDGRIKEMFVHEVFHDTLGSKYPGIRNMSLRTNELREYYLYNKDGHLMKVKKYDGTDPSSGYYFVDYYVPPDDSSIKLTGMYFFGRKHGHWTWWSKDGEIIKKCTYDWKGKKISKDDHIEVPID